MAKTTSKTSKGKTPETTSTPVVETTTPAPVVETVASVTTETKKTATKKAASTTVETTPATTVETVAPVTSVTTETTTETHTTTEDANVDSLFSKIVSQVQELQNALKTIQSNLKVLQKEAAKERRENAKLVDKCSKKTTKRKVASGFAKSTPISNDLASFLGMAPDTQIARTEVTSLIIAYIKNNNLQNPERKKEIIPDAKLKAILQPADGQVVTFFNLQTFLKKHFISVSSTSTTAPTVV